MGKERRPAAPLDALEAARVAVEAEYLECMHGFEIRADSLRALLDGLALTSTEGPSDDPPPTGVDDVATSALLMAPAAEPAKCTKRAEWNLPPAGVRGWLITWLLGDMLPKVGQRQVALERALVDLQGNIALLRDDVLAALGRVQDHAAVQLEARIKTLRALQDQQYAAIAAARLDDLRRWRGIGEALDHTVEALTLVTRLSERLREVVNAKDAEALQRAVAGPSLQIEVIFDELTRRQEALLAELVGRRQELDELIASVSGDD